MRRTLRFTALFLTILIMTLLPTAAGMTAALPSVTAALSPSALPVTAPPSTSAASAVLYDATSEQFLALSSPDVRRPMASTTKIMTALVVLEKCTLSEYVTVASEAVGVEGSSIYLFAGEQITVETLLYGLLLSSANDAAAALAIHTAGSIAAFADLMNERAAAMGLSDTHFANPHGLHDEAHYTTARELALIAAEAMKNEVFSKIVATKRYSAPQIGTDACRLFLNHNRLLRSYEDAVGVKTGYTRAGGRCLVSAAQRDGLCLIAVTLNDGNDWRDHAALLDWGFAEYTAFTPVPPSLSLPVVGGEQGEVSLVTEASFSLTLPQGHGEIICRVEAPHFLFAGFEGGKEVGRLVYALDGREIGTLPLYTANGVEKVRDERTLLQKIKDFFKK